MSSMRDGRWDRSPCTCLCIWVKANLVSVWMCLSNSPPDVLTPSQRRLCHLQASTNVWSQCHVTAVSQIWIQHEPRGYGKAFNEVQANIRGLIYENVLRFTLELSLKIIPIDRLWFIKDTEHENLGTSDLQISDQLQLQLPSKMKWGISHEYGPK